MASVHGSRKRLKQARIKAGISGREMADMRGVHWNAVWETENRGEKPVPSHILAEYAEILAPFIRVSAQYLRTGRY